MIKVKTIIKFFVVQFLLLMKIVFSTSKIKTKSFKVVFITKKKNNIFNSSSFKDFLIIIYGQKKETTFDREKKKLFIVEKEKLPETNADLLIFDYRLTSHFIKAKIQPNYIGFSVLTYFLNFKSISKFLIKKKYSLKYIPNWKRVCLIFEKKNILNYEEARRFIPFEYSRIEFLKKLKKEHVNFVVLRWYNQIEGIKSIHEDIDLLIDVESLTSINNIIRNKVGVLPVDIFSNTGEETTDYSGVPYFPRHLSNKILETKIVFENSFFIPNKEYYLIALVYHVVFHKSVKSGLDLNKTCKSNYFNNKKRYDEYLTNLFIENKFNIPKPTLFTYYEFLKERGFSPNFDLILKLANLKNDIWYKLLVADLRKEFDSKYKYVKGLSVLFLRENAYDEKIKKISKELINEYGFEIIEENFIEEEIRNTVNENIRGGKWDIGLTIYKDDGGYPRYYFLVYDPFLIEPDNKIKIKYPHLENKKIHELKKTLRREINKSLDKNLNAYHSSDDFYEAIFYLKQLNYTDDSINSIIEKSYQISNIYKTNFDVHTSLSRTSMRAKIELIEYQNKKCIKKTYKIDKKEYLDREIWFLEKFIETNFVPKIIDKSDNYVILEYFENSILLNSKTKTSSKNIKEFQEFVNLLYINNITLLDLNPSNVLLNNENKIKFFDFEYAQFYKKRPNKVAEIYELGKLPEDELDIYPMGHLEINDAYDYFWKDKLYLTKNQFFGVDNVIHISLLMYYNKFYFKSKKSTLKIIRRIKLKIK